MFYYHVLFIIINVTTLFMGKYLPKYGIRGKYPRTLILFSTQYKHYEVMGHLDDTFTSTVCNNAEWSKLDNLVAMWIYGTISQPILTIVLNDGWTLHHILKALEVFFETAQNLGSSNLKVRFILSPLVIQPS